MFEVIYKYLTIVFLIVLMFLLTYTAYEFYIGSISVDTIFIHKVAGIALLVVTLIHIIIRRKKLKKLTQEFFNIFSKNKKVTLDSDMDKLLDSLETKNLEELCTIFDLEFEELEIVFKKHKLLISSKEQTLEEIAKSNSYKTFPIIVKIIEYKAR
ncbi:hypothetical protein [Halarcobacter bivalviorum]|uniref:Membrane protein n=1 Tax=Halarcobacter bivalviorum TaxID=663364 RepID=A0AAX2AA79_9BACT|nr:hypothetical protein [Halarcobacter bivalviorum]AXH11676.1 putative membrane protein [Halarcobacter bivalviorum]RXK10809.1 hypothetical protein CRV05_00100 [Halarcobacter bivalviorum]